MRTTLIVAFVAVTLAQMILGAQLPQHRTDIGRGENPGAGPSWSWQINVFVHATYDERGQRLKRWVLTLAVVQFALILTAVLL